MLVQLLLLLVGLIILTGGAELLVRGASSLALRWGLSALVVGLTMVAFGTSAPEFVVSISAAINGNGGIAVGNIVGSNIFNIGCILGLAALICPLKVNTQIIRREMPVMLFVSVAFPILLLSGGGLERWEGLLLVALGVIYTTLLIRLSRRESVEKIDEGADTEPKKVAGVWVSVLFILGGLALLLVGMHLLVDNAVLLARRWGVSDSVIGLSIVAAGTSFPELATSVVAALRRETDIAVGNIVGSNIFNILFIGGATGTLVSPVGVSGITNLDFGFMIGLSIVVLPLMWTRFSINRYEGIFLLSLYAVYLYLILPTRG